MNILLLEDESLMCEMVSAELKKLQCNVFVAPSIHEAHEIFHKEKIQGVITDIALFGESGLDFISQIFALGMKVPFVVFTGVDSEVARQNAMQMGCKGFLEKPASIDALRELLMRLIVSIRVN